MKVRTFTGIVHELGGETLLPGVHEVGADVGNDWIGRGIAELVEPDPEPRKSKAKAED